MTNAETGSPIDGVDVIAYRPNAVATCPNSDGLLYQDKTRDGGKFTLQVDPAIDQYRTAYCANNFQTLDPVVNNNTLNGADIIPRPVRLFPLQPKGSKEEQQSALQAILRALDAATKTFLGMRQKDPQGFEKVRLSLKDDADTVNAIAARKTTTPEPQIVQEPAPLTDNALLRVLDDSTIHVRYFARVAPVGVGRASSSLFAGDAPIVIRLLTRPLGLPQNGRSGRG